jgi:hypothetical protein
MTAIRALILLLLAPLVLSGCFLTPGKFVSTLDIRADRGFTFTYQGEVIALDLAKEMAKDSADETPAVPSDESGDAAFTNTAFQVEGGMAATETNEAKYRAIVEALRKEPGYRSVEYAGDGKFVIDYALTGTLDHSFVFPFNIDAEAIFPFVAIELRGPDTLRVKAPAFGASDTADKMGQMGKKDTSTKIDGTFTLTTDAEIVSQNNEAGASAAGVRKSIVWRVTPLSKDAPMAVLRVKAR